MVVQLNEYDDTRKDAWADLMRRAISFYPFDMNTTKRSAYVVLSQIVGGALLKYGADMFNANKHRHAHRPVQEGDLKHEDPHIKRTIGKLEYNALDFLRRTKPWRIAGANTWYNTVLMLMKGVDYQRAFDLVWKDHLSHYDITTKKDPKLVTASLQEGKIHSKVEFGGLNITIEVPAGGVRRGKGKDGKVWERKVKDSYGYFLNTNSPDGEHLDVWFKKKPKKNCMVYVVHQMTVDGSKYDEDKVMLGYASASEAEEAYKYNCVAPDKQFGGMSEFDLDHFKVMAFSARNSSAILAREETVEKMRKKGTLPRGIKSPVEVAKVVKESLDFNTDVYGGVTIVGENTRCYLNGPVAEQILEAIEECNGSYTALLQTFVENYKTPTITEELAKFRVIKHVNNGIAIAEKLYDIEMLDRNGQVVDAFEGLNTAQVEDARKGFLSCGVQELKVEVAESVMLGAVRYGKKLFNEGTYDGLDWLAEAVEQHTGLNYFELLEAFNEHIIIEKECDKEEKEEVEEAKEEEKTVEESVATVMVPNPTRPVDILDRENAIRMAKDWAQYSKITNKTDYVVEMLGCIKDDMRRLSESYGFDSFVSMAKYLKYSTSDEFINGVTTTVAEQVKKKHLSN